MREPPAHSDDSIEEHEGVLGLRLAHVSPGERHAQRGPCLACRGERFLKPGWLVPLATISALAEGQRDAGARAFDLLGERPIMPGDDGDERLEAADQFQRNVMDLEAHDKVVERRRYLMREEPFNFISCAISVTSTIEQHDPGVNARRRTQGP